MSAEDEARARLEVAQLYVEMGQAPKAARYYLNAAEIYRDAGLGAKARELFNKVLELDPGNAQAQAELNAMGGGAGAAPAPSAAPGIPAPTTGAAPAAPAPGGGDSGPPPPGATGGKLQVPTPVIYMRNDQRAAVIAQVTTPPDPSDFPFDPLPKVDMNAIAEKQAIRKAAEEAEAMKNRTVVESAFNSGGSPGFSSGSSSGLLGAANLSSAGGRKKKAAAPEAEEETRRGRRRSGTQDLADSIRRRMRGS